MRGQRIRSDRRGRWFRRAIGSGQWGTLLSDAGGPTTPAHPLAVAVQKRVNPEAFLQGGCPPQSPRLPEPFLPQKRKHRIVCLALHTGRELFIEMFRTTRLIPIGDRPFGMLRQDRGESRGRWEGETLVVETRNFKYGLSQLARGASRDAVLVERFRRVSPDILEYEFTVDDPATWTTSWTARQTWRKNPAPMFEYACHEGNYGMINLLSGARQQELVERAAR